MQARENEAGDMCDRAMRLAAFPGKCSYKSETGGRLKELRELTNATVQNYHKAYYRPQNLCVIVTGQVDLVKLCEACAPVIESIHSASMAAAPAERPFSSPVPRPETQQEIRMEFPAEDEKTGAICELAWHGPAWEDIDAITALDVLLAYLCQDSISPLRKALVETVPPLCGKISEGLHGYSTQLINITLKSCDVEQLSQRDVTAEMGAVFEFVAAADGSGIDIGRIRSLVRQKQRKHLSAVEADPHELFSGEVISAFCYAPEFAPGATNSGASLRARLDTPAILESLLDWPPERWASLCKTYFKNPGVTVVGLPSKACGKTIQEEDARRIAEQKECLGEEGCKEAADLVAAAEDENDVDTPDEVAQQFQVPDVSKVALIDVSTVTLKSGVLKAVYGKDAEQLVVQLRSASLPELSFQFDHVSGAQFVKCHAMVPITNLTERQLMLLPLWCDVAFELPLKASSLGPAMQYEAVVQELTDTTVSYGFSVGIGGSRFGAGSEAGNMLHVTVKVEKAQYVKAPHWIARILADAEFDAERLQIAMKRILNDVPNTKRNGRALMMLAKRAMSYRDDSAHGAFSVFRVEKFLSSAGDDASVKQLAKELVELRDTLLQTPAAMLARVAGDVKAITGDVFEPWRQGPFGPGASKSSEKAIQEPALARELFAKDMLRPGPGVTSCALLSSSAEESNYWQVMCDSFSDPRSPELAPLMVALEYITALEGPFWRKIRGKGYSYGYSLTHNLDQGSLTFSLTKATNPLAAFQVAEGILRQLCGQDVKAEDDGDADEDEGLDPSAIEAAQSGVIFGLIEPVDTVPGAMGEAFDMALRRQPPDQLQWLLQAVQGVSEEDVRSALQKHVLPLFTGSCGRTASIVCPEQKRSEIEEGLCKLDPPFKAVHFNVESFVALMALDDGYASLRSKLKAVC